jgi:hypothetical protein
MRMQNATQVGKLNECRQLSCGRSFDFAATLAQLRRDERKPESAIDLFLSFGCDDFGAASYAILGQF